MEKDDLEKRAADLLHNHDVDATDGFDIVVLAQKMGFVVGNAKLADDEDGLIAVDKSKDSLFNTSSNMVILVNRNRDYYFKRFIVAHELGHYMLEGNGKQIYAHRKNKTGERSENEQEVDYFAANLLMPKDEFTSKYYEIVKSSTVIYEIADKLSKVFQTPMESIYRRLEELGLLQNCAPEAGQANGQ